MQSLERIQRRDHRRGSGLLDDEVAWKMDANLHVVIDEAIGDGGVPNAHDQVLPLFSGCRSQKTTHVHLGEDREALSPESQSSAHHCFVVIDREAHGIAMIRHRHYGNPSMSLLSVPNLSEGRRDQVISQAAAAVQVGGAVVLDIHRDAVHNRSVLTVAGEERQLVAGAAELAATAARLIDLRRHRGVHPRLGVLDVCPFVPLEGRSTMADAARAAGLAGRAIGERGFPVYLYGRAEESGRSLPALRRALRPAIDHGPPYPIDPDLGPRIIDPAAGLVCVGARGTLIAFNVWLATDEARADQIAQAVRESGGGAPGIRALGLDMGHGRSQVSMNLIDPAVTGIEAAFDLVEREARVVGARVLATEIVGLVPERFLPGPETQAARLLVTPGRSLESVLPQR